MSEVHVLEGLEPDNLLASLALFGFARAVQTVEPEWQLRLWWEGAPLRPLARTAVARSAEELAEAAARGCAKLAEVHDFAGRLDLDYAPAEARQALEEEARAASWTGRDRIDLLSALMNDVVAKEERVRATPYCAMFGQGHQHFLERLAGVPKGVLTKELAKSKTPPNLNAHEKIAAALFHPWERTDPTQSFRWDPAEDRRYALRYENPSTDKGMTMHGANRLAAIAFPMLTAMPVQAFGMTRLSAVGVELGRRGVVRVHWPVWSAPAAWETMRAMWMTDFYPRYTAERISVGKFFNFTRGEYRATPPK